MHKEAFQTIIHNSICAAEASTIIYNSKNWKKLYI